MTNKKCEQLCPVTGNGCDCISKALCKVGVCRSTLITLALLPFAWDGVIWFADALRSVWELVSGVGS